MTRKPALPPRLLITLPAEERAWLEKMSREREESMAEIVREAVAEYRTRHEERATLAKRLDATFGIRRGEDSVAAVRRLRREWDR